MNTTEPMLYHMFSVHSGRQTQFQSFYYMQSFICINSSKRFIKVENTSRYNRTNTLDQNDCREKSSYSRMSGVIPWFRYSYLCRTRLSRGGGGITSVSSSWINLKYRKCLQLHSSSDKSNLSASSTRKKRNLSENILHKQ